MLRWIEVHNAFCLVLVALMAPFAAAFVGLVTSKRQARALLDVGHNDKS